MSTLAARRSSVLRQQLRAAVFEALDARRLMSGEDTREWLTPAAHGGGCVCASCSGVAPKHAQYVSGGADKASSWYAPAARVVLDTVTGKLTSKLAGTLGKLAKSDTTVLAGRDALSPDSNASADLAPSAVSYATNAAGLPLLSQRPAGQGVSLYLDMDGHDALRGLSYDANFAAYDAYEQSVIYNCWRDIASYFNPFDVNVTTVLPTGGTPWAWHLSSPDIQGGYAYVGWLGTDAPHGFNNQDDARYRTSGIAHEFGHLLGLSHQSEYDAAGAKSQEYTEGWSDRHRPIMGVDFAENVRQFVLGRNSDNLTTVQDDLGWIANKVRSTLGNTGDGYRPDDVGNTVGTASAGVATGGRFAGVIERTGDLDVYRVDVPAAGRWLFDATPTEESSTAAKVELLTSTGFVVAAADDADLRNGLNNDVEFAYDFSAAGTYYLRVASHGGYGDIGEYEVTASPLPGGLWQSRNIGAVMRPGTVSYESATGTFVQTGAGGDIWNNADEFRFTSQILRGDGSITARVDALENTEFNAKAALMVRETLAGDSKTVVFGTKPGGQLELLTRDSTGAAMGNRAQGQQALGNWLRLSRAGNVFTAQTSTNGTTWSTLGTYTLAMNGQVELGLAVTSHQDRQTTTARFANVSVTGATGPAPVAPASLAAPTNVAAALITGTSNGVNVTWTPTAGAAASVVQRSVNGSDWETVYTSGNNAATSFAAGGLFGSMRYFFRVLARDAAGLVSAPSAAVSVVNRPSAPTLMPASYAVPAIRGNGVVHLNWRDTEGENGYRVERSLDNGATWAQQANVGANVTSLAATGLDNSTLYKFRVIPLSAQGVGAPLVFDGQTVFDGLIRNLRVTARANASISLGWNPAPAGTTFTLQRSTDGTNFATVATPTTNSYTDTNVVGGLPYYYRVTGANAGVGGTAYNGVTFAAAPGPLPVGWNSSDVGTVGGAGAGALVTGSATSFNVSGSGAGAAGTADGLQFTYATLPANGSVVARVESLGGATALMKAGVMVRGALDANAASVFLNAQIAGRGVDLETRSGAGASAVHLDGPSAQTAPVWLRLTRAGQSVTAEYSTNGTSWLALGGAQILGGVGSGPALAGIAVTSADNTRAATARFTDVSVALPNNAPTVQAPATVSTQDETTATLAATFADDTGAANLAYAWSVLSAPANAPAVVFTPPTAANAVATFGKIGTYQLRLTATDAGGLSTSTTVTVNVAAVASDVTVTGPTAEVAPGAVASFAAVVRDQFDDPMAGAVTWSATGGAITSAGAWTAPAGAGVYTVVATAVNGASGSTTASVQLVASNLAFRRETLPQRVQLRFNGDVTGSLAASDVVVLNRTAGNAPLPAGSYTVGFDAVTEIATVTFANGPLADGRYRLKIDPGTIAANGVALSDAIVFDFAFLLGDVDGDGQVAFSDLSVVAANYGQTGRNYAQGNFSYDAAGAVNFDDLSVIAARYGTALPALRSDGGFADGATIADEVLG